MCFTIHHMRSYIESQMTDAVTHVGQNNYHREVIHSYIERHCVFYELCFILNCAENIELFQFKT
jgi:hypothetical protein